ncbi:MAG: hypothetical protein ACJ76D_00800, partial [Solirubrobacterales bacterium]
MPLLAVGGFSLLGSMYLPWYQVLSGENFCEFLLERYGADFSGIRDSCANRTTTVNVWNFDMPSMLLLASGVLAVALAVYAWRRERPAAIGERALTASLAVIPLGFVIKVIAVPLGPADTFTAHYGAWVGAACAGLITLGAVGRLVGL